MRDRFHISWQQACVLGALEAAYVPAVVARDVVNVPAHSSIRVRIPFEDFTGNTVYHCHILDHEDLGMMGVIEVK